MALRSTRDGRGAAALATACSFLVLVGMLFGGPSGAMLFVAACVLFPVILIALSLPGRRVLLTTLALLLEGLAVWIVYAERTTTAGGLPLSAWIMLLGLGVGTLVFVSVAHAATFDLPRSPGGEPDPAPPERRAR